MTYGPTASPTPSPLAFDGYGKPVLFWQNGLSTGQLPRVPKIMVDLETQDGATASVLLPGGVHRVLVDDPGKEYVVEHHGVMYGPALGATLGVYLVTEQRSDGLVSCEVVVHNGIVDPKVSGSWRGCLRFKKIRVRVITTGWSSTVIDTGAPGDWYFGTRVGFTRRFVCFPTGDVVRQAAAQKLLNYADLLLPDPLPCVGAGRHQLPRLMGSRAEPLWNNVPPNGPLVPDTLTTNGYESGGAGINPIGGFEGSEAAAKTYGADVTRILSRHGCALADKRTGEPVWPELWPALGTYGLFDSRYSVDPWNWAGMAGTLVGMFGWNRQYQSAPREINPGPCTARVLALAYQPHNGEHLQRVTCRALPAWQQLRSWGARWLLRMSACDVMNSWPLHGTLGQRLSYARQHPGLGGDYIRFQAWIGEAVAASLSITHISQERDRYLDWREAYLEYLSLIPLSNGFARSGTGTASGGSDNGVPWQEGLPVEYGACAVFQLSFWANTVYNLWVNGPTPAAVSTARYHWMLSEGERQIRFKMPLTNGSPRTYVGVTKNGAVENPIYVGSTTLTYTGHANHDHHALALAWKATGDQALKQGIFGMGQPFSSPAAQLAAMRANPDAWKALAISIGGAT